MASRFSHFEMLNGMRFKIKNDTAKLDYVARFVRK